jgi:hypothetical protein
MTKELDEALVAKYPKIFRDRYGDMKNTCMCWGFECRDGWYFLIDNLCKCIQDYCDDNPQNCSEVVAVQVKEKFGSLRFYVESADDMIEGMIWFAEHLSAHTCEVCGKPGEIVNSHDWFSCVCPEHSPLTAIKDEDVIEE